MWNSSCSLTNASAPTAPPLDFFTSLYVRCWGWGHSSYIYSAFLLTDVALLLPLSTFVLCRGFREWWRHLTSASAFTVSHSDCFTYNAMMMELLGGAGCVLILLFLHAFGEGALLVSMGNYLLVLAWQGQTAFHVLTCVERYLAVVRPLTYVNLRRESLTRSRNIFTGFIWLQSLLWTALMTNLIGITRMILNFVHVLLTLIIISFCSLSIMRALLLPGPGEQRRHGSPADRTKLRAFHTILLILGLLSLRCSWNLLVEVVNLIGVDINCIALSIGAWCNFPSSLVLPVLFLQRTRN